MPDLEQNDPQQITRPPQFPTATRIENGVAYDISGKALGNVDESNLPSAQNDPFAGLKGVEAAPQKAAPQQSSEQDPFAGLSGVDAAPINKGGAGGSWEPAPKQGFLGRVLGSGDPLTALVAEAAANPTIQKILTPVGKAVAGPGTLLGGAGIDAARPEDPTLEDYQRVANMPPGKEHDEAQTSLLQRSKARIQRFTENSQGMLNAPLVDFSAFVPTGHPLAKGVTEALSGFTSPQNVALMFATGGFGEFAASEKGAEAVSRLVSAGFSADMVRGLYNQAKELKAAVDKNDWDKVQEIGGQMIVTATGAVIAGHHGVTGEAAPLLPDYLVGEETKATRTANKAMKSFQSASREANISDAVLNQRTSEASLGAEQANKARLAAEAAQKAEQEGKGTREATIAAQENASAAAADAVKKQRALKDAQDAHSANLVKEAQLNRDAQNANTELEKIKADRKAKADAKEAARVAAANDPMNRGLLGKIGDGYEAWHEQRALDKEARQNLTPPGEKVPPSEFGKDFMAAFPATKTAAYSPEDVSLFETYAKNHHDNIDSIDNTPDMRNALQHDVDSIDDTVAEWTKDKFADKKIVTNPREDARARLSELGAIEEGFLEKGMVALEPFNLDNPTLSEAADINTRFNAKLRAIRERSIGGDRRASSPATLRETDPEFAAIEAAQNSLRNGLYGALEEQGVKGAREMKRDQAALIRIKNAVERQYFSGEKKVRGTSTAGPIRKIAAKGAAATGAIVGAGVGESVGGPIGATFGAGLGAEAGRRVGRMIAEPDLTRDATVQRMVGKAQPGVGPKGLIVRDIIPANSPFAPDYTPAPRSGLGSVTREEIRPARTVDLTDVPLVDRGGVIRRQPVLSQNRGLMLPAGPERAMLPDIGGTNKNTPLGPTREGYPVELMNASPNNEYSPLHADLATHYGESIGETPYQKLEERFRFDVATKREHGVPLDSSEKSLLKALNTTDTQAVLDWRKQQEDAAKEAEKTAAEDAKGKQDELKTKMAAAPFKVGPEFEMPEGSLDPFRLRTHEAAHQVVADALGFQAGDVISNVHPEIPKNSVAEARWDKSSLMAPSGDRLSRTKVNDRLGDIVTISVAGPVSDELIHDIPMDTNIWATGDMETIRNWFKALGVSEADGARIIERATAQAREILGPALDKIQNYSQYREAGLPDTHHMSSETVQKMLEEIRGPKEPGEDNETNDNKPITEGPDKASTASDANAKGENEGGAANVRGNGKLESEEGSEGGGGRPVTRKVAELSEALKIPDWQRQDSLEREIANDKDKLRMNPTDEERRVLESRLKENRKDLRELYAKPAELKTEARSVPNERSTGDEALDKIIRDAGAVPGGNQNFGEDFNLDLFHDPTTGSTLALKRGEVTPEAVKAKLQASREAFAKAKEPKVSPNLTLQESAQRYTKERGLPKIDHSSVQQDTARAEEIARRYDEAEHAPNDPRVKASYDAFKKETLDQFHHLRDDLGLKFEPSEKDPYKNEAEMMQDIKNNNRLKVFTGSGTGPDHPLSEIVPGTNGQTYNTVFRWVHDAMGHAAGGHDFSENGEKSATEAHAQMYSEAARPAMRNETEGQTSWYFHNPRVVANKVPVGEFPEQKANILPDVARDWSSKAEEMASNQDSGAINPRTGRSDTTGIGVELMPELRMPLDHLPLYKDFETFYRQHEDVLDRNPELRIGWDKDPREPNGYELNIGAVGPGAVEVARKLDQRAAFNIDKGEEIPTGGTGKTREFPNYSLEQRLADLRKEPTPMDAKSAFDRIKKEYGESSDASKTGEGASFIAPNGKFVHLGVDDHPAVINFAKYVPSEYAADNRVPFINESGAIRSNFTTGRAGRTLSFSVPKDGVTPEQIDAMKAAVRDGLGTREGQLRIETANTPTNLKNSIKDFATANDVEPMLREIGAHAEVPELKTEARKTSNADKAINEIKGIALERGDFFVSPKGEATPDSVEEHRGMLLSDGSFLGAEAVHGEKGPFSTENTTHEDIINNFGYDTLHSANAIRVAGSNIFDLHGRPTELQMAEMARLVKESGEGKVIWDLHSGTGMTDPHYENTLEHLRGKFIDTGHGSVGDFKRAVDAAYSEPSLKTESRKRAVDATDVTPIGSSVGLRTNPLPIKGTTESGVPSVVDVAKALNKFTTKQLPALELKEAEPEEMRARAKELALDEAKYQLAQNNTGAAWYTTDMAKHDDIIREMRPALADPAKLSMFKMVESVLSSGQNPYTNIKSAIKAWDVYEETGKFPGKNPATGMSWGPRNVNAYSRAINSINNLIAAKGEAGASEWLLAEHPIRELREWMEPTQSPVTGKADDMAPGVMILGPKRGPFAQNLHGQESAFTADVWVSRTWNRWMGTTELQPDGELLTDRPRSARERTLMKASFEDAAKELGMTTSSLQAVLWYYEQALYQAHGANASKETWSFSGAAQRLKDEEDTSFNFGYNDIARKKGLDILAGKR